MRWIDQATAIVSTGVIGAVARMLDGYFKMRSQQRTDAQKMLDAAMSDAKQARAEGAQGRDEADRWRERYVELEHLHNSLLYAFKLTLAALTAIAESPGTDAKTSERIMQSVGIATKHLEAKDPREAGIATEGHK